MLRRSFLSATASGIGFSTFAGVAQACHWRWGRHVSTCYNHYYKSRPVALQRYYVVGWDDVAMAVASGILESDW